MFYQRKPILEHEYSDRLMEKLLEANDQDLNRQKVAPFEADLDKMTEVRSRAMSAHMTRSLPKPWH